MHVEASVCAARVTYAVPICVHVKVVAKKKRWLVIIPIIASNYSS